MCSKEKSFKSSDSIYRYPSPSRLIMCMTYSQGECSSVLCSAQSLLLLVRPVLPNLADFLLRNFKFTPENLSRIFVIYSRNVYHYMDQE